LSKKKKKKTTTKLETEKNEGGVKETEGLTKEVWRARRRRVGPP